MKSQTGLIVPVLSLFFLLIFENRLWAAPRSATTAPLASRDNQAKIDRLIQEVESLAREQTLLLERERQMVEEIQNLKIQARRA